MAIVKPVPPIMKDDGRDIEAGGFRLMRAGNLQPTAPAWLIRGFLERDSLALVFGDPGVGKSFLALDWACHIATAREWLGQRVAGGPVIYVPGEGHNGIARRLKAWQIRHGVDLGGHPLFVANHAAEMNNPESAAGLEAAIDAAATYAGEPRLVVLDTLARNFGPGDENSTQDMTAFIAAADHVRLRYRCAVLLVHHSGHADKTRARGAMALKGALDTELRLERDETGVIRLEASKMKDGPHPDPLAFRLRAVELGLLSEDGQPVTSAVLDPTSYEPPPVQGKAGRGKHQTLALEVLAELYAKHRATREASGHDPDGARVSIDDWRSACIDKGIKRNRFGEVRDSLTSASAIHLEHGYVWRR